MNAIDLDCYQLVSTDCDNDRDGFDTIYTNSDHNNLHSTSRDSDLSVQAVIVIAM